LKHRSGNSTPSPRAVIPPSDKEARSQTIARLALKRTEYPLEH